MRNRSFSQRWRPCGCTEDGQAEEDCPEERLQPAGRLILTRVGRGLHQLPVCPECDDRADRDEGEERVEGGRSGAGSIGKSCRYHQSRGNRSADHGYIGSTLHRTVPAQGVRR